MRQTLVLLKFVVVLSSFVAIASHAEPADVSVDRRDAQSWLKKIHSAAQQLNYSGTFVYQQENQIRTSRITHLLEGRNEREKLEILDGKPREYIRNNEEIICYVPEIRTLLVEKRVTQDVFPAILAATPAELAEHYDIRKGETGRVAGFDCQALILQPKDKLRYGYKLWAEKTTGLLLRAQTLNERSEVVEQIAFTQLAIGNIERARVKPSYSNTAGWRIENAVMSQATLTGWSVKEIPAGFRKIREMKRMISDTPAELPVAAVSASGLAATAVSASATRPTQRELLQIVYSDGLAAISIFIEPVSQSRTEGSIQQGAMNITGKRQGDFWLTIVGEVPAAAIKQVANSIEFKPK
ncbi:MAG: MucB/RseB C-terminal domain-containing protein [Herminiimonas sp.]|nr:MucB/RseB C-terminal domain-containing protein [Herminiimonas sp.]